MRNRQTEGLPKSSGNPLAQQAAQAGASAFHVRPVLVVTPAQERARNTLLGTTADLLDHHGHRHVSFSAERSGSFQRRFHQRVGLTLHLCSMAPDRLHTIRRVEYCTDMTSMYKPALYTSRTSSACDGVTIAALADRSYGRQGVTDVAAIHLHEALLHESRIHRINRRSRQILSAPGVARLTQRARLAMFRMGKNGSGSN